MKGYIYFIKNKNTETYYIGASVNYRRRFRQHMCASRYTTGWHVDLHEHPEDFETGVLEIIEEKTAIKLSERMCERENYYYEKYRAKYNMYNIRVPQKSYMVGQKFDEERIQKHRECHEGIAHKSEPNKEKLQESKKALYEYIFSVG